MRLPDETTITPPDSVEGLRVLQGILGSVQGVIGEGAAQALFRYGAFEEGKRLAKEGGIRDMSAALKQMQRVVRLDAEPTEVSQKRVVIEVRFSETLTLKSPILDTLLLGLIEGSIAAVVGGQLRGEIEGRTEDGSARLVFRPEAA